MDDHQQLSEIKTDVRLLLECLQYHGDSPSTSKQALLTLGSIFSRYDAVKEYFQEIGGLQFIFNQITSITNAEVKEASFFCLGCCIERNVTCQKTLTSAKVFGYIHGILSNATLSYRLKQTAVFFMLNLVSNNGQGQVFAKSSRCLADLLELLRITFPNDLERKEQSEEFWCGDVISNDLDLWSSIASTICMCVNNPRNNENQRMCGFIIPFFVSLLKQYTHPGVVQTLMSLIGFTVASNTHNQEQFRRSGGLPVLVSQLKIVKNQLSKSDSPEHLTRLAGRITSTLDACISDNIKNAKELEKTEAVPLMLFLLKMEGMNMDEKLQIVLTLGHTIELSDSNKQHIDAENGLPSLVKLLTDSDNEEFSTAVKYLLQMCISNKTGTSEEYEEEMYKRLEGVKILQKIDDISNRLNVVEKETAENSKGLCYDKGAFTGVPFHNVFSNLGAGEKYLYRQLEKEEDGNKRHKNPYFSSRQIHPDNCCQANITDVKDLNCPKCHSDVTEIHRKIFRGNRNGSDGKSKEHHRQNSAVSHFCSSDHSMNYNPTPNKHLECIIASQSENVILNSTNVACIKNKTLNSQFEDVILQPNQSHGDNENVYYSCDNNLITKENNGYLQSFAHDRNVNKSPNNLCEIRYEGLHCCQKNRSKEIQRSSESQFQPLPGQERLACEKENISSQRSSGNDKNRIKEDFSRMEKSKNINMKHFNNYSLPLYSNRNCSENSQEVVERTQENTTCQKETLKQQNLSSWKSRIKNGSSVNETSKTCHMTVTSSSDDKHNTPEQGDSRNVLLEENSEQRVTSTCTNNSQTQDYKFVKPAVPPVKQSKVVRSSNKQFSAPVNAHKSQGSVRKCGSTKDTDSIHCNDELLALNQSVSNVCRKSKFYVYADSDCSSIMDASEFDLDLVEAARSKNAVCNWSQNCKSNDVMSWATSICMNVTPLRKSLYRPAYSDGIRPIARESNKKPFVHRGFYSAQQTAKHLHAKPNDDQISVITDSDLDSCCFSDYDDFDTSETGSQRTRNTVNKEVKLPCPGCGGCLCLNGEKMMSLNSRTYNILLETSTHTCNSHRKIRKIERQHIEKLKTVLGLKKKRCPLGTLNKLNMYTPLQIAPNKKYDISVYDLAESENEECGRKVSPPCTESSLGRCVVRNAVPRRCRIPYTEEEENNLIEGVNSLGTKWNQILVTFKFHPNRKAVDLKEKYNRMLDSKRRQNNKQQNYRNKLFSMCEERRLLRGVKKYGYNWKTILQAFTFSKERSAEDLRSHWRVMHRKKTG